MAAGYSYQPQAPFIRTNMDSGLARQRRRFIKVSNIEPGAWTVSATLEALNMPVATPDQYVALRDFGEDAMHSASSDLHSLIHVDLPGALVW
jgi:hypothetical protein